jgi:hypothetical protein
MGVSWSRKHLQALGLKDGFVVIDGAPLWQVVGLADEFQQEFLIASQLCLTLLQISASFPADSQMAHFIECTLCSLQSHLGIALWVLLTVREI